MSIVSEIQRLQNAKAAIKAAIEAKGVTVASDATIDDYATYVGQVDDGSDIIRSLVDRSVTSFVIPNGMTSIGASAFRSCVLLEHITIPNTVTVIKDSAFVGCSKLKEINIPSGVTLIEGSAFNNCTSITSIVFPASAEVKGYVCSMCYALESVVLPTNLLAIENNSFQNCRKLSSIIIPSTVIAIKINSFTGCSSLTSITIPNKVTEIGNAVFNGCSNLESVFVEATVPPTLGTSVFNGNKAGRKIYVPYGSLSAYQTATNWSEYANDMETYNNTQL